MIKDNFKLGYITNIVMMRRIIKSINPGVLSPKLTFRFSEKPDNKKDLSKYKRKFTSQFELQILMLKYLNVLQTNKNWAI